MLREWLKPSESAFGGMSDENASDAEGVSLFDDVSVLAAQFLPS